MNLHRMKSSQRNEETSSDHGQKFDVFLSHSGKQKNFVRQLYKDLTSQGVSCFFDQDRESLPVGEAFPPRIFEAIETCSLAVFLLSKEFLQTKWPMLELATCVKGRDTITPSKILPLFFIISPEDLKQITTLDEKWKGIGIEEQQRVEWHDALKAICRLNGLKFIEGGNEPDFRDEIVKEIWHKLPTASPRYHVPYMQGELRMCRELADFLKNVHPNEKGIIVAGLHGIAGQGKTTLGKAFCNHKLKDFEGKVCHLEFSRGDSLERSKLALRYLNHCHPSYLRDLTKDQAQFEFHRRVNGQRVFLVLDNITEESIDEVIDFMKAGFREKSCIILSARSLDLLVKHCKIDPQSCLCVPRLEEDDAIAILLERMSPQESTFGAEDKAFALKCANRCSFKVISYGIDWGGRRFHPLALKVFGRHLFGKYSSNLSKWVAEIDDLVDPSGYGLDGVFAVLDKAFDDMDPKYRTIFMLLSIYIPPSMSFRHVTEWLAISCNKEIEFINEAVKDLCKNGFIEEFKTEICIHDLYFEFAQSKAKEMGRWLCWKGDGRSTRGFISQDNAGFELVKLEGCMRRSPSEIVPEFLQNLLVFQLVDVQSMNKVDLGQLNCLKSITLHDCKILSALDGMENLKNLAWLQIRGLGKALKLPKLSSLIGLQHLEIDITVSQVLNQLGDLTPCFRLKEINVRCPSLLKFPRLNGLPHLEKVKFSMCYEVNGCLDCTECTELQSIVLVNCCKMAASPLLAGCKKLSEIVLSDCGAVMAFPDIDLPGALKTLELQISSRTTSAPKELQTCYRMEKLHLLDMEELVELPSFRSLSSLTVLEIGKCGIREPPDLTSCVLLEDVHFYTLKRLVRFPNFSLLRKLKKLNLCNCSKVRKPPDISGCHQLQLFSLQHNSNMKGLPKMDECTHLEEVKVSWQCEGEVRYKGIDPDSCEVDDDLEACLDFFKDVILENLNGAYVPEELKQWVKDKTMLAKKYFRGVKLFYSVTAPYEWDKGLKCYSRSPITLRSVGSKVLAYATLDSVNEDYGWLKRVREYLAGRDIGGLSSSSGNNVDTSPSESPMYHFETLKTTTAKAFRDFGLGDFDREVWHRKSLGGPSVRQKLALHYLSRLYKVHFEWETRMDRVYSLLSSSMDGERILLVLDSITENCIDAVRCYVWVELGKMRFILWTARSLDAQKKSNVNFQSLKWVEKEDVLAFSVKRMPKECPRYERLVLKCANRCSFKQDGVFASTFHQLALGRHSSDLSRCLAEINCYRGRNGDHLDKVFDVLNDAFQLFDHAPCLRNYFYHLEKWIGDKDGVDDEFAGLCWLAIKCVKATGTLYARDKEFMPTKAERATFEKDIESIKAKLSSHRVVEGRALNCERAIKKKVEENKHSYHIEIYMLLEIINEKYTEADGSGDHSPSNDGFQDGLPDDLDHVFRTLKCGFKFFYRPYCFHWYIYLLENWRVESVCVDDVFAGLWWLAIKWGNEFESSAEEDVEEIANKFKKEIKNIKAKLSSDEVVKLILMSCKKEIKEKIEDIKRKNRREFVSIKETREKEEAWKIAENISFLLRCSSRYDVPSMQGEARICQEVADFLNTVYPNEKGIRFAGLYGMAGLGKTTLAKAFCNHEMTDFAGKVCVVQYNEGNALDRQKLVLQYLTQFPMPQLESVTSIEDARYKFYTFVKGQRVLLVLDNITEDSIDEVRHYLEAEYGKNSCIFLIAQSVDVLKNFNIDSRSSMHVPLLEEEEALAILLGKMYRKKSVLGADHRHALNCANRCSFKEGRDFALTFHPLALKAFGQHLFRKHGSDLSKWVDGFPNKAGGGLEGIFDVLEKAFDDMDPRYRRIFIFLARHMPQNKLPDNVIKWLAINCNEELTYIKQTVKNLCENGFIEEIEPEFHIHDMIKEFVHIKQYKYYDIEDEAKFSNEILRGISRLLPQKYHIPAMQGEVRICQEVAEFFDTVHPNEKRVRSAGLYGMPGMGKTTIAKLFCNLNFENFGGKVYHLEFASQGNSMESQNSKLLTNILEGQRVLLVLDNIQSEESIDVVRDVLQSDIIENSWILLIARSVDVLKNFIEIQSCMRVPGLEEEEAIAILLERTTQADSALKAEYRDLALQCANKSSFKETNFVHTFHPLALKTFGQHFLSKYGSDLSKWVPELDGLVIGLGDGLGEMFTVLDKFFEDMDSKYQTMFMLLTVYMPPHMPHQKVSEWLAVNCKEELSFIEKAVEDLWQKAFIEEIKPEIRIHDLFMEFAQSRARKMRRWLWCNQDLITSEAKREIFSEGEEGFELAKLEHCQHQDLFQIGDRCIKNLWALQISCNEMSNFRLNPMKNIRSLTLHNCEHLEVLQGMENLPFLAWLQVLNIPKLKVLNLSSLIALQYLEINSGGPTDLGDLTGCVSLTEIYARCPSLWEFPRIKGLPNLEKARFKSCEEVNGPLDCRACVKLQSISLENCWQMAHIPLIDGCSNISKIVLNRCDQVTECSDGDESSALEIVKLCVSSDNASVPRHSECCGGPKNILLWNIMVSMDVPSLRRFSKLTVLKLYNCDICEAPDLACCKMLEDVYFSTLKNLESFPTFSSLRKLKKLCLCNCQRVQDPPDIGGCYELQVFHLLYNDNMKRLPKMDGCHPLEEIKMGWRSSEVFDYSDSYEYEDLEFCLDYQKDGIFRNINDVYLPVELKEWQWIQNKRVKVQQYFRGGKQYYSIACSSEWNNGRKARKQARNGDPFEHVIIHRASGVSDEDELRFRDRAVNAIGRLIPPRIRFPFSSMQKETTLNWLEKASTIKGLRIANLYEVAGSEETVLRQSFYNFRLKGFEDEVTTLEFLEGNSLERLNNALLYLTCAPAPTTGEILIEDAFSQRPTFNIMILLIKYAMPDSFMDNNLMDIARDFHINCGGNTRMVFHSQMYTIIELSRA